MKFRWNLGDTSYKNLDKFSQNLNEFSYNLDKI